MDNVGLVWWQYTAQFPLEEAGGLVLDLKVSDEDELRLVQADTLCSK